MKIEVLRPAQKDLRKLTDKSVVRRITTGIRAVASGETNVDVKPLAGHSPWFRLRVGDFRVLYRLADIDGDQVLYVLRVISRGELETAVGRLPEVD